MKRMLLPSIVVISMAQSGCANLSPLTKSTILKPGSSYWLSYDSTRRGAYVSTAADGSMRLCAEPAPDAVYNYVNKLEAAAKTKGVDAKANAELTANALQLAGRDRIVLTAREGLFRLCEAEANGDLKQGEYFDGFQEVMYTIRAMFDAEKAAAVNDLNKTSPEAAKTLSESFSKAPQ